MLLCLNDPFVQHRGCTSKAYSGHGEHGATWSVRCLLVLWLLVLEPLIRIAAFVGLVLVRICMLNVDGDY